MIQEKKRNFITIFLTIMIGNFIKGQKNNSYYYTDKSRFVVFVD